MKTTKFMQVMFSAVENNDEELALQVAQDIERAKENGEFDTDEVKYVSEGDGRVSITDKVNNEVTIAEPAADVAETYDLYPAMMPDEQLEGFLHPEGDGVTPGMQQGEPMERVEDHLGGMPTTASVGIPVAAVDAGMDPEMREFSVSSDNLVVQRIFSSQEFCERLFSEVIESEETAVIGDLKIEKDPDVENTVVVTSESTGDQARVTLNEDDMDVTELESKNFCGIEESGYLPMYVVGVDRGENIIVEAPVYDEIEAQEIAEKLAEKGVEGLQVIESPDEVRDYAYDLLQSLNVEEVEEPVQAEFSDTSIFLTKFYSASEEIFTDYMERLYSEDADQDEIEDAIASGEEIENDSEIITPIDASTAVIEDKETGEFTKVVLDGEEMDVEAISEEEAEQLCDGLVVGEDEVIEGDEEEREYSDVYCNDEQTRFFSETEEFTNYMVRLYSEDADQEEIEDAIESGEEIENDSEIITPIDASTAVIEDKETGEFTKVVLDGEEMDVQPISKEEADELCDGLVVGEDEVVEGDEEEREYSNVYCNDEETRFFSETEEFTNYMERLYSEDADQEEIEDAIESGEQIENDSEIITPIDASTAVIEDKETGEFTKVVLEGEDMDVQPISEEEADELCDGLVVGEDEAVEGDEEEREYSTLSRFFSEMGQEQAVAPVAQEEEKPTLEAIEDKALAAIQGIQGVAEEATQAIMEAKEAPVEAPEDLKEAQFSEVGSTTSSEVSTLDKWLNF